ncbi:UDP-N-acetylenolpyruvoylglucosamine reductase [Candidatus Giovannonibacteria bacterium RIFCSPHIGHO2_02_FULL_46_20]|uniref:UDP-N-acetylenolpyruvoylglucosamine reductase n=1 Tax=Candidatus Giovannonibacteria bacterium RIFCSPHIGHO2_02_FULL_46_20 TaxID=1798338 RepID=A0A1F5WH43_9BACT|nr:MAG: UDP-N-acetylenolpyruvoylglucosamine reductase [Candidatus Giovannonibacteria bacterium RIFCSPHIGHO2_02_FULL_46_20]
MSLSMLNIREHISLRPYTVFKIGGPALYFCEIQNVEELQEATRWAEARTMPFVILGAGSNVLISDEGYSGLVIRLLMRDIEQRSDDVLHVAAGASMAAVAHFATTCGLGGFEWAIGIPGTVGGSIFGNAGCYGGEMKDVVERVNIFDASKAINYPPERERLERAGKLPTTNCLFSYRYSIFKKHPEWIIVSATLKLVSRDPIESAALMREYGKKRATAQDIGSPCAGCIFKNFTPSDGGAKISAGQLIDAAGLKGTKVGGAMVSFKHGNFIINTGNATAEDVKQLIVLIKEKIKAVHGAELEEEIRIL